MSAITITLSGTCAGGNHLTVAVTGDKTAIVPVALSELTEAITADDVIAFTKIITKMARAGRTLAQARILMQNGITVNV